MSLRHVGLLVVTLVFGGCLTAPPPTEAPASPTLILLSFDGWRWDYNQKTATPNVDALVARGVRAERLIPVYPTKTFPNHYTIVTGLYPERHGIVGNAMLDPDTGDRFSLSDRDAVGDGRWWGGEPLWVTAERQGLAAACFFWPGSEAPIAGRRPRHWRLFDNTIPNDDRVDQILAWLDLPAGERPAFITGYFSDADSAGHRSGPDSVEVIDAIARLDQVLGRLMAGLTERGIAGQVDLAVVSDHGMAAVSSDQVIALDRYVDLDSIDVIETGANLALAPRPPATVDDVLTRLAGAHPHLQVYRREASPVHWQHRSHPRIPAVVGVADAGWTVVRSAPARVPSPPVVGGQHGYDPQVESMHGLFIAAGPSFRRGITLPSFENVHLYEAFARALGIVPAENDGDTAWARGLLIERVASGLTPSRPLPSGP